MKITEKHTNNLKKVSLLILLLCTTVVLLLKGLNLIDMLPTVLKGVFALISLGVIYPLVSAISSVFNALDHTKNQIRQLYKGKYIWLYVIPFKNHNYDDDDDSGGGMQLKYAYAKVVQD